MKQIGEQVKYLRKKRNMTQEQLAARLGISAQSVSKWENRLTSPDISLLPALATVFEVSIDTLFDYNQRETEEAVMAVCRASWEYREYAKNDRMKMREILDEGLRRFPGHPWLLNNYLYTLDYETENDEIIRLATDLIESVEGETRYDDVRFDALQFLAAAYARAGETAFAKATVERIPEFYFSKRSVAAQVLQGEEKYKAAYAQKWESVEMLVDMMRELAIYYQGEGQYEKAKAEKEKARQFIRLFADEGHKWVEELLVEVE